MPEPSELMKHIPENHLHADEITHMLEAPELPLLHDEGRVDVIPLSSVLEDVIPRTRSAEDIVVDRLVIEELFRALRATRIQPRTITSVWWHYAEGDTFQEISDVFGITRPAAGDMAKRALLTLRGISLNRGIHERY